jgi:hypothetical protein
MPNICLVLAAAAAPSQPLYTSPPLLPFRVRSCWSPVGSTTDQLIATVATAVEQVSAHTAVATVTTAVLTRILGTPWAPLLTDLLSRCFVTASLSKVCLLLL